jgi:hypothetical protein
MRSETRECLAPLADTSHERRMWGEDNVMSGLTLSQAEELLDWLEARGYTGLQACLSESKGVTVFWAGAAGPEIGRLPE